MMYSPKNSLDLSSVRKTVLTFQLKFVILMSTIVLGWLLVDAYLDDTSVEVRRWLHSDHSAYPDSDSCAPPGTVIPFPRLTEDGNIWLMVVYIMGVMYMFIALAIICDEYFVPSLEVIAEEMDFSPDVAGATLMAAGGSAPELFTSAIGTFTYSDVGFGTITGSAVFNVLFVIAMCAIYSEQPLKLTWWPLARDCTYYIFGLLMIVLFFVGITPKHIYWWEALILFICYLGYVALMANNVLLYDWICDKLDIEKGQDVDRTGKDVNFNKPSTFRAGILRLLINERSIWDTIPYRIVTEIKGELEATFETFDKDGDGFISKNELTAVLQELDMECTEQMADKLFHQLDTDQDNQISFVEFKKYYIGSEERVDREMQNIFKQFDKNGDGKINHTEIRELLITAGADVDNLDNLKRGLQRMSTVSMMAKGDAGAQRLPTDFDKLATSAYVEMTGMESPGASKTTDENEAQESLNRQLEHAIDDFGGIPANSPEMKGSELSNIWNDSESITFDVFKKWYQEQMFYKSKIAKAQEEAEHAMTLEELLTFPRQSGCAGRFWWVLVWPLMGAFYMTVPDTRRYQRHTLYWALTSFATSIAWIGCFSIFMVDWTVLIGEGISIPSVVMGVTFLAAGTSVPDLLSSVIVAKRGFGDMAVSSSIGSNIFDILVGLPIPWLVFGAINLGEPVVVGSDNLIISIMVLLAMVFMVIVTIMFSHWEMSKRLGYTMFVFYVLFLIQDLAQADWTCAKDQWGI